MNDKGVWKAAPGFDRVCKKSKENKKYEMYKMYIKYKTYKK